MKHEITTSVAYRAAEVYEQFFVSSIFRYWTPVFLDRVDPQPGEQVLDVACGTGIVARSVLPMIEPDGKVASMDANPAMLEVACRQFSSYCDAVEWHEGRAENLPFKDKSFDLVLCQQGLQFFNDRPAAVREMRRVLKKDGRVGIEVWQALEKHPFYSAFFEALSSIFNAPIAAGKSAFAFGDPVALADLLQEAGFTQVKVESVHQSAFFQDPGMFVNLMFRGAAAELTDQASLDAPTLASKEEALAREVDSLIKAHLDHGVLTVPLYANIATAVR